MKIVVYRKRYRNDFSALLECEHCHTTHELTTGYDDFNYHNRVLPAMRCTNCYRDRAGNLPAIPPLPEVV
jgi:hypothetical protein